MAIERTTALGYGIGLTLVALGGLWSLRTMSAGEPITLSTVGLRAPAASAWDDERDHSVVTSESQDHDVARKASAAIREQAALAVDRALQAHGGPSSDDADDAPMAEASELAAESDVIRPSDDMPSTGEFQSAFAMLEQQRQLAPRAEPDLELAEGLLHAIGAAQTPMDRFALINAYLDAIAGISDEQQALAARKRLAEVGAAPDALFIGDSSG